MIYCTNCDKQTNEKVSSICTHCGFDLTHVIKLLNEPDDDDDIGEDIPKTAQEIAKRALVLSTTVACAYGDSKPDNMKWLKSEGLWDYVSPNEQKFLLETNSDKKITANLTWKIEALIPLLWAIKKIDTLPPLAKECDTESLKKAVIWPPASTAEFISSAELRNDNEITEEYEKVYQAHWKVRDAKLNNKKIPNNYNPSVVYERHYAFNWLTGYMGQSWDDISTDT